MESDCSDVDAAHFPRHSCPMVRGFQKPSLSSEDCLQNTSAAGHAVNDRRPRTVQAPHDRRRNSTPVRFVTMHTNKHTHTHHEGGVHGVTKQISKH